MVHFYFFTRVLWPYLFERIGTFIPSLFVIRVFRNYYFCDISPIVGILDITATVNDYNKHLEIN